eukprot:1323405-Amorphochlora_amoeboformis.AAC.2
MGGGTLGHIQDEIAGRKVGLLDDNLAKDPMQSLHHESGPVSYFVVLVFTPSDDIPQPIQESSE